MSENKKNLIYVGVLVVLIAITFTVIFQKFDFNETMGVINNSDKKWLAAGCICNALFVVFSALSLKVIFKSIHVKIPMRHAIKYILVEQYFCAITPSASGGQPMEMLEMKRDGIKFSSSTIALIVIAIAYKGMLLVYVGIMALMGKWKLVECLGQLRWLFDLGIAMNVIAVLFMLLALFCGESIRKTLLFIIDRIDSIHHLKRHDEHVNRVNKMMKNYREGAGYILKHKSVFYKVIIFIFLQRASRFAVTYMIYKSFGLTGTSAIDIILLQACVSVSADMIPIPGAVGVSESCYLRAFKTVFGIGHVAPSMVLSRGISFYGLVLAAGIVVVILQLSSLKKTKG